MDVPSPGPLIGVAAASQGDARHCLVCVEAGGGASRLIAPGHGAPLERVLSGLGALVVLGFGDVYGDSTTEPEDRSGAGGRPQVQRAAVSLVEAALDRDMPLLAIGDGVHLLNRSLGGRAPAAVAGHAAAGDGEETESSYHRVFISPGSKLAAVVGAGGFVRVNSRHPLALREAQKAPSLLASAYALDDGVIEALESPSHRWVIGVQFHPERRMELPPHFQRLFASLADRAAEYLAIARPHKGGNIR